MKHPDLMTIVKENIEDGGVPNDSKKSNNIK